MCIINVTRSVMQHGETAGNNSTMDIPHTKSRELRIVNWDNITKEGINKLTNKLKGCRNLES